MSLSRYSAAFNPWRKCKLLYIDRKPRKLFTIYERLDPKSDVDRLYILPKKDGGRGLIATEDCAELAVSSLEVYVHASEKKLI